MNIQTIEPEVKAKMRGQVAFPEHMKFDRKLHIAPVKVRSKTDRERELFIEHRIGIEVTYTKQDIFKFMGYEKAYFDTCIKLEKKFGAGKLFDDFSQQSYSTLMRKVSGVTTHEKKHLKKFYASQGIQPLSGFAPVPGRRESAFAIFGFVDAVTKTLVLGDVSDIALYGESTVIWSKSIADKHKETLQVVRQLLKLGVNKDIANRLNLVLAGDVSKAGLLEYQESKK